MSAAQPRAARAYIAALLGACAWLAACTTPPPAAPPAPAPSAADACRALIESLTSAVPPGESLADIQVRGIRIRTPLSFPPGSVPRPLQSSGAAVQLMITPEGTVVPGSPKTVKSVGEPQIANAMEAAALSMTFDIDASLKPTAPIPFTTTFAVCVRS